METVSFEEALGLLRIGEGQLKTLLRSGQIGYDEVDGEKRLYRNEVEIYAQYQRKWRKGRVRMRNGQYITGPTRHKRKVTGPDDPKPEPIDEKPLHHDHWLSAQETADTLGLTMTHVRRLAKKGLLAKSYAIARPTPDRRTESGPGYKRVWYRMSDVIKLQADRESREKSFTPREWQDNPHKPYIRWPAVAPPNDRLITREEAADILGVKPTSLPALYKRGRLFIWQEKAGRSGSRVWLSLNQVCRYADDPDRKRRRAWWTGEPKPESSFARDRNIWMEERDLDPASRKNMERDHGEYFSTRQTARVLDVSVGSVQFLRKRKRLPGYRLYEKEHERSSWWFYKKDDVYDLKADHEYRKRHEIGKKIHENISRPALNASTHQPINRKPWEEWKDKQTWNEWKKHQTWDPNRNRPD